MPRQNDGISRNIHSNTIAAVSRLGFGLPGSLESNLSITVISGAAIPMKKKNTIMYRFAMDGDLNLNEQMYVNPALAGPNNIRRANVLLAAWRSVVMKDSKEKCSE